MEPVPEVPQQGGRVLGKDQIERAHQDAADDHTPDVPQATQDHHRQHHDRDVELELERIDELEHRREQRAGEPGE